jgi:hypothetical protein
LLSVGGNAANTRNVNRDQLATAAVALKRKGKAMSDEKLRALPREVPDYHSRQSAHLRALAENATSARLKTRLLREAELHEQAAEEGDP